MYQGTVIGFGRSGNGIVFSQTHGYVPTGPTVSKCLFHHPDLSSDLEVSLPAASEAIRESLYSFLL